MSLFLRTHLAALAMIFFALVASPAFALDLEAARASGAVGEAADGYVAVRQPSPEVNALAAEVNAKRRAAYADIAARNGTAPEAVATLTAERVIARLPKGAWVHDSTGAWIQK